MCCIVCFLLLRRVSSSIFSLLSRWTILPVYTFYKGIGWRQERERERLAPESLLPRSTSISPNYDWAVDDGDGIHDIVVILMSGPSCTPKLYRLRAIIQWERGSCCLQMTAAVRFPLNHYGCFIIRNIFIYIHHTYILYKWWRRQFILYI